MFVQDLETMSREMDTWVRDAQVQQQRYDEERRKTEVELEPLLIKLQVRCGVVLHVSCCTIERCCRHATAGSPRYLHPPPKKQNILPPNRFGAA